MSKLPKLRHDENLLVGLDTSDDAAVYKVSDDVAIIQTLDFFTPVVDDPYLFGQIAAANALSDIYAMGGTAKVAMNIVAFPNCLPPSVLGDIMKGGADKVAESGALLIGGHSIQNDVPLYGLSVTGFVHPEKIQKNYGAKEGDILIITKQVGTGVVSTAAKVDMASKEAEEEAIKVMTTLNRLPKEIMDNYPVHACTDVTGFGLLGHGIEMAEPSEVSFELYADEIPYVTESMSLAETGMIPEGAYKNKKYFDSKVDLSGVKEVYGDLLFDPQTSGGLLYAVEAKYGEEIIKALKGSSLATEVAVIGKVVPKKEKLIYVR
jgi:selenide, water dikinase